jgi:hypothetical protein
LGDREEDVRAIGVDPSYARDGSARLRIADPVGQYALPAVAPFIYIGPAVDIEPHQRLARHEADCRAVG